MPFDAILAEIKDEAERTQIAGLATKYPQFKTLFDLGEQVSPVVEKLRTIPAVKNPLEELGRVPEWIEWRDRPEDTPGFRWLEKAAEERDALKTRVADLESKAAIEGVEMTVEEMVAKLKADGQIVTKEDLKDVVTQPALLNSLNQYGLQQQNIFRDLDPLAIQHHARFGESMPYQEIFDYMNTHQIWDPEKKLLVPPKAQDAYKSVIAPKEAEMTLKRQQEEVAKAREEGAKAGRLEAMQGQNGRASVVDGGGGKGVSRFMSRIFERRAAQNQAPSRLGDGTAAREGMEDFLKRQAGAV